MDSFASMDNRIELEKREKRHDQVIELILDNCRASKISGLTDEFVNLECLSLINVGLVSLKGFPNLPELQRLDLCDNRIAGGLDLLSGCPKLQHLNISGNRIKDLNSLEPLKHFLDLQNLDIYNCELTQLDRYQKKVLDLLPCIQSIDGFSRHEVDSFVFDIEQEEPEELKNNELKEEGLKNNELKDNELKGDFVKDERDKTENMISEDIVASPVVAVESSPSSPIAINADTIPVVCEKSADEIMVVDANESINVQDEPMNVENEPMERLEAADIKSPIVIERREAHVEEQYEESSQITDTHDSRMDSSSCVENESMVQEATAPESDIEAVGQEEVQTEEHCEELSHMSDDNRMDNSSCVENESKEPLEAAAPESNIEVERREEVHTEELCDESLEITDTHDNQMDSSSCVENEGEQEDDKEVNNIQDVVEEVKRDGDIEESEGDDDSEDYIEDDADDDNRVDHESAEDPAVSDESSLESEDDYMPEEGEIVLNGGNEGVEDVDEEDESEEHYDEEDEDYDEEEEEGQDDRSRSDNGEDSEKVVVYQNVPGEDFVSQEEEESED